jgi:rhodanese-related sulfurtransferase
LAIVPRIASCSPAPASSARAGPQSHGGPHSDGLEPILARELLERAKKSLITVLDVRPPEEFAAGHLPGAVNIPVHELEKRLGELPKRKEVVAYCRGPYCLMSYDAVQLLRKKGLKARRLQNGLPEWRLAGLPVTR